TQKMIQLLQRQALCHITGVEDAIPDKIRESYNLCHYQFAIENIHFPKDTTALELAKRRLIFEELLIFGLGITMLRKSRIVQTATPIKNTDISAFIKALPFTLTQGQQDAISDGLADMQQSVPMNRLCQGDVGCGKTMVASALAYACAINGFQTAIMAPTQILAEQHYKTISQLLQPLGISVCLVTSKMNNRKEIISNIKNGTISIVIGTHAILTDDVEFDKLNLVVTDEQHRFGVSQRSKLSQKGENPHLLVMSATPIPRTLALIIYGDLDISVIAQLPNGRQKIETYSVSSKKRARALNFIKKHIDEGRQAYIVCPLIEENESDLISTNEYMDMVKSTPLNEYSIALLDGKMKNSEKEKVMSDFRDNKIKLLIATSVVEVGVDVPNAVVMLIENAERFGLSQLHQLRGRVGRGEYQSYCILISDNQSEDTKKRLSVMTKTCDGFEIANQDLMQRGPGDFFGVKQHGLPKMKIANLVSDMQTLQETQKIAIDILQQDSDLSNHKLLKEKVEKLFSQTKQDILN
ncbi:MAG: ATP-dependent DNA helicase RecG, partial [Oscillospiraceae bacterium]